MGEQNASGINGGHSAGRTTAASCRYRPFKHLRLHLSPLGSPLDVPPQGGLRREGESLPLCPQARRWPISPPTGRGWFIELSRGPPALIPPKAANSLRARGLGCPRRAGTPTEASRPPHRLELRLGVGQFRRSRTGEPSRTPRPQRIQPRRDTGSLQTCSGGDPLAAK